MNTYEEAKRILSELSLENIALRRQVGKFQELLQEKEKEKEKKDKDDKTTSEGKASEGQEEEKVDDLDDSLDDSLEAKIRKFAAQILKSSPSLLHFFTIVVLCYLWGRWYLPFWCILLLALPWLEIIKTTDSERLANDVVTQRYLRRLLVVDDDQYTIGDTAAWLNRAMVRLWPNALEPMVSQAVLESVQAIFDDFLSTQSIVKRLKVEGVSLGEVPLRIKRIRTSLPEENVAVTKKKAGRLSNQANMAGEAYEKKQNMAFDALLRAFQKNSEENRVDIDLDVQLVTSENMKRVVYLRDLELPLKANPTDYQKHSSSLHEPC